MRATVAVLVTCLTGCATPMADPNYLAQLESYRLTIVSQQSVEVAKARAEEARYQAMAVIAERADPQSKQMALLALALGGRGDVQIRNVEVALPSIPKTQEDRALQWAAIFAGPTTALVSSYFGYQLGKTQSNNQANTTIASYNAMAQFKPVPIDWTKFPATTDSHNIITTTTNTRSETDIRNRDGFVVTGGAAQQEPTTASQDNRVTPVTPIVPVVVVPPVVQIVPVTGP